MAETWTLQGTCPVCGAPFAINSNGDKNGGDAYCDSGHEIEVDVRIEATYNERR
ncbi:MAG: hypothetical protein M0Z66_16045 [Thermaerobacter sp.]|nr:hypothetical protein [Thermaerobacter sp.]